MPLSTRLNACFHDLAFSWVLLDPFNTFLDVLLEVGQADIEEFLLVVGDLAHGVDLLYAIGAKLHVGGEEIAAAVLVERRVNKGRFNDVLLALSSLEQALSEARTSHSHGESSRASTILSLDDLVTAKLNTVDVAVEFLAFEVVPGLREEGDDSGARMSADNGDVLAGRVGALELRDEARGTDNVERGNAEEALGVVDAFRLENLGGDGNSGVDLETSVCYSCTAQSMFPYRVRDDQDVGLWSVVGGSFCQIADDGGIGVEKV